MNFVKKLLIQQISRAYNLTTDQREEYFDILWEVFQIGNKYQKDNKDRINSALQHNYRAMIAAILRENVVDFDFPLIGSVPEDFSNNTVFKRIKTINLDGRRVRNNRTLTSGSENKLKKNRKKQGPTKFVIFSDHHITPINHSHNYFSSGRNKSLYIAVLNYYSEQDFGLIENGDVEEYTIFEPTDEIIERYDELVIKERQSTLGRLEDIGSINWSRLTRERINNRIDILRQILSDHSDLYDEVIDQKFSQKGKGYYTKITGNHDPYVNRAVVRVLPKFMRDNLCDALRINYRDSNGRIVREPKYFVTHGHQFDTSTLPQHAFAVGEVISETLGWFIQGADRIWDEQKTGQWRIPEINSSFRNILATAESDRNSSRAFSILGEGFFEDIMQHHEIAWEYFDEPTIPRMVRREVLTGDEYFKVRHLSETELVGKLSLYQQITELSSYQEPTKLIIGHTHEPRLNSRTAENDDTIVTNYLNSGSAGRFDNLIWGIELIDGTEKIVSWTFTGTAQNPEIYRNEWVPNGDGEFTKIDYPM